MPQPDSYKPLCFSAPRCVMTAFHSIVKRKKTLWLCYWHNTPTPNHDSHVDAPLLSVNYIEEHAHIVQVIEALFLYFEV